MEKVKTEETNIALNDLLKMLKLNAEITTPTKVTMSAIIVVKRIDRKLIMNRCWKCYKIYR
jgi:hypothetical protein